MKVHKAYFDENKLWLVDLCSGKGSNSPLTTRWNKVTCKKCLAKKEKKK